jgi:hypothetical protein
MPPFRIGLSVSDSVSAFVFDLPGCAVNAVDSAALLELLPVTIAEHLWWLQHHGNDAVVPGALEFDVVEEVRADAVEAADAEFCFDDDRRPLGGDEIADAVRVMEYARTDLLSAIEGLPDAVLDWRPPASAMARIDEWKPRPLTIREIVKDIAGADHYYRTGLRDDTPLPDRDDELHDVSTQRARVISALQSLAPQDRARVFRPQRPWQSTPEEWTARKMMRRLISHERFHTAEIRQRLSWLLLGVPEFHR